MRLLLVQDLRLLRQGWKDRQGSAPEGDLSRAKGSAITRAALYIPARPCQHLLARCRSTDERELDDGPSHPVGVGRTHARATWQHIAPLYLPLQSSLSRSDNGDLR